MDYIPEPPPPPEPTETDEYLQHKKDLESYDFIIHSDGSAIYGDKNDNEDDFGGYATLTSSVRFNFKQWDFGCGTNLNTNRAELLGGLMGLRRAYRVLKDRGLLLPTGRATVLWKGDRQNLMEAVANTQSRKSDKDLWDQFAFYERFMKVEGRWSDRDTGGVHQDCDRISSELRWKAKEFARWQDLRYNVPSV